MPKISVIVPVYNVEKYLRRCLESIKNQTFMDWEAICVNDGSPDDSAQILNAFEKLDARFKVVNKENGGLSDARNVGMQYATGDYVLFVDSDDFIHPQTMEIAYAMAQRDGSDIVSFTYDRIYRPQLMVRHKLGLDTDNVVPARFYTKYNLKKLKTKKVDDIFQVATERTHNKFNPERKWLIKHCQVWKNLYKRELIQDIDVDKLADCYSNIQIRFQDKHNDNKEKMDDILKTEKVSLRAKMHQVVGHIVKKIKTTFSSIFSKKESKAEIVTGFLAVLELDKRKKILIQQEENFGEITITPGSDIDTEDDYLNMEEAGDFENDGEEELWNQSQN